jgi:hypothetical protein|tara:strand:+ start:564 stop:896 length:333 start_codon:yes stop_codon:yes gene_type:complete
MSKFFESEIIRDELKEINQLQQDVYGSMLSFGDMEREDQIEHIEMLSILLEKQRVMYTRLSLSDDPDAVKMKEQLEKSVELMGFPAGTDISVLFSGMTQTIEKLKQVVDP